MKKVNPDVLMNWWLGKYHNTSLTEVIATHSEETLHSPEWFKLYPVTEEQYEEWKAWAKEYVRKETKCSKKTVDRGWGWIDLQTAPYVIIKD